MIFIKLKDNISFRSDQLLIIHKFAYIYRLLLKPGPVKSSLINENKMIKANFLHLNILVLVNLI